MDPTGRTTRTNRTTRLAGLARTPLPLLLAALAGLGGCRPAAPDNHALIADLRAGRAAEVTVRGQVTGVLPDAPSTGPDGPHERFLVGLGGGVVVEVDHNLTLAPRVPVTPGSTVTVHGQFEPDPGHPVIHYTHHATGGHEGGWVELNGHRYS